MKKLVKTRELVQMLGVSKSTIHRWAADPKHPLPKPLRIGARSVGWHQSDIQAWIDSLTPNKNKKKQ